MKKTDCHVYPFVEAVYWWFLIVYILIVRTRVPYYIRIKWYKYHYMHSFFFAFSGCRIIEIFFFTFLFFILCIAFTFQIHIHFHIFTSEVTCYFCYFCYCQIIFLLFYLFTFLPLNALLPFKLRPDAAVATSRRVWHCVGT